jgi:hypothetical protein
MTIREIWLGLNRQGLDVILDLTLPELLSLVMIFLGLGVWIAISINNIQK